MSPIRPLQHQVGGFDKTRSYQIQEFAHLAGTTVRALQHYDRLGVLSPARTASGARQYSPADIQALVQIMALKSVGVSLKQIGRLRAMGTQAMAEALETERRALERRQPTLDRVIFAIRNVESALGRGEDADPAVLGTLMAALKSDDPSSQEPGPPSPPSPGWDELEQAWRTLLADLEQQADQLDPAGPELQALALRWDDLMTRSTGGGSYRTAFLNNALTLDAPSYTGTVPGGAAFLKVGAALARLVLGAGSAGSREG